MGPPPRRQPAARPGASDSPPGTGMGRGRAGGGGARGAPAKLPKARGPAGVTTHPLCARLGLGARGKPGASRGGGEERGRKMKGEQTCLGVSREPRLARALPAPQPRRPHPRLPARRPHSLARADRQPSHFAARKRGRARIASSSHFKLAGRGGAGARRRRRANARPDERRSNLRAGAATRPLPSPAEAINCQRHLYEWGSRSAVARGGRREGAGGGG